MSTPIIHAVMSSGATWDDPSEDLLYMLMDDIRDRREEFLIVGRVAAEQYYMQVTTLDDETWLIEYREGGPDHHFRASTPDFRLAHSVLARWASNLEGWRDDLPWDRVRLT